MKRIILAAALALGALTATAQDGTDALVQRAAVAQATDIGTTLLGVASGCCYEANPAGLGAVLAIKALAVYVGKNEAEPMRTNDLTFLEALGWGFTAHNALVLLSAAAGPAALIGAGVGTLVHSRSQPDRDEALKRVQFDVACAKAVLANPRLTCIYTPAPRV